MQLNEKQGVILLQVYNLKTSYFFCKKKTKVVCFIFTAQLKQQS